jgi:hypothetical protein
MKTTVKCNYPKNFNSADMRNWEKRRNKFLNSFKATTLFAFNRDPSKKTSPMIKTKTWGVVSKELENVKDRDVYFYVNGYSTVDEVKSFKSCFVDLDAGRDSNGKYYGAKIVLAKKRQFLNNIKQFKLIPSWIVETRNGYQCYWLLSDRRISRITWQGIQKKLANYFGGDAKALKPNQLFRVPYTMWNKPWEGKVPFLTDLLSYPGEGTYYTSSQLQESLNGVSAVVKVDHRNNSRQYHKDSIPYKNTSNTTTSDYPNSIVKNDSNQELIQELIEFLQLVGRTLNFSNQKYLGKKAFVYSNTLSDKFCIG